MLVQCNLHNLRNLKITIYDVSELFSLVDCDEFMMIRRPHIIIDSSSNYSFDLEKSDDNNGPVIADRKYVTDVFKAFPDVYFTIKYPGKISTEKAIHIQKKYQNVEFKFINISVFRDSKVFSRHLE